MIQPMTETEAASLPMPTGSRLRFNGNRYIVDYLTPVHDPWGLLAHACKMAANGTVSRDFVADLQEIIGEELDHG